MEKQDLLDFLDHWENMELLFHDREQAIIHFPVLMEIALSGNGKLNWRASWAADKINTLIPGIAAPWIDKLVDLLPSLCHPGKKRQFLKLISLYPVPADSAGFLFDFCLERLASPAEEISIKAYSMQILYNISEMEPGLKPELLQILEEENEHHTSAGVLSKAKTLMSRLRKEIKKPPIS